MPSGWYSKEEEDCVTFSADRGIGALQISSYRRENEIVTDEDLYNFAENELVEAITPERVSCGDFDGITISYDEDETFWRKFWLRSNSLLLYVTYNCDLKSKIVELAYINLMLSSLKAETNSKA